MTARINEKQRKDINGNYRKENHFFEEYAAVAFDGKRARQLVTLRIYETDSRSYCCFWINGLRSASGTAGGYGYHRASAAAQEAIYNAGIDLSDDIGGRGGHSIENAVEAIAKALAPESVIYVVNAHA